MKTRKSAILRLAFAVAAAALNLSALQPAGAAAFANTSPMSRARSNHTATLLPNGKVLVAGIYDSTVTELFDPATRTWTQTGTLRATRGGQTATLLLNGKVLVTGGGGAGGSGVLGSAELYDPATGTWNFTGSMRSARANHTATLLSNGKVLLAGGYSATSPLSSAELYDPASGTWTYTGAMRLAREGAHTATLLPNGKVLVAGGYRGGGASPGASAELYDPLTGRWTDTGALSGSFNEHTATLLPNGKVLITGGCPCRGIAGDNVRSAAVYDPARGIWTPTGSLITGRGIHTATLLPNGKVLVTGGYPSLSSAELYDPTTETWQATATMSNGRWSHTATLLPNGNVLVAGGMGPLSSAAIYQSDIAGGAPSITLLHHSDQILSFSWTGAGTLEQSDSLTNWLPVPVQDNPHIASTANSPMKFFRVRFNQ